MVGKPEGASSRLTLSAVDLASGQSVGSLPHLLASEQLEGNIALVSQFSGPEKRVGRGFSFRNWQVSGKAFSHTPGHAFGPIMWSMYSLSDSRSDEGFVMKLTALFGPMGEKDNKMADLEVLRAGVWQKIASSQLDTEGWTASFRIPNWQEQEATPCRVVYREAMADGGGQLHIWPGTIRPNPTKPLRIGALTCQNALGFPYQPVADNLVRLDPDLLFFSGDQLYESHGGFGVIRDDADMAVLNYLRKYYMFGWAFRGVMAEAPTIVLPDDHDVFHGNI